MKICNMKMEDLVIYFLKTQTRCHILHLFKNLSYLWREGCDMVLSRLASNICMPVSVLFSFLLKQLRRHWISTQTTRGGDLVGVPCS